MKYRDLLYSTYVSANKRYLYQAANAARVQEKAIRSTVWSLRDWLPDMRDNLRVLDLGCGAGVQLSVFQKIGYQDVVGVDRSTEQVELARRAFPNVVEADIFDYLNRADIGQFDLITAFDVIEHFTRDEAVQFLRLAHQRLKSRGMLMLQMPNGDSPFAGSIYWSDLTHETLFTAISLRHLLEACGFVNCQFRERGPVPLSVFGVTRVILWQIVRLNIKMINYIETGNPSTNIYTRVFACRAFKGQQE